MMLICSGLYSVPYLVGGSGTGNAHVSSAIPVVTTDILDSSYVSSSNLLAGTQLYFNVSIIDTDGVGDIENVTIQMVYKTFFNDDPRVYYNFSYDILATQEYQTTPTTENYLNSVGSTVLSATEVNYSFSITLNKTAQDSNGESSWHIKATVLDTSANLGISPVTDYIMSPLIEMTYWGNAGSNDFLWTGAAESNQTLAFNTLSTSNDFYWLNASYSGVFQAPWGEPDIWIRESIQTDASYIPDWETATPGNTTWYTASPDGYFWHNLTHYISLEFPAGLPKDTDFTGVTIWIQASND